MRECKLGGSVIALAEIGLCGETIIKIDVEVPATYTSDWQTDGGYSHDEGFYDYDIKDAEFAEEFEEVMPYGFQKGYGKINKIIKVYSEDLQEVA